VYQEQVVGQNVPLEVLKLSSHLKVVDGTPNYLWMSDRVPARILCAAPWVKMIVLLRNPVDRAFSQYNMQYHRDLHNSHNRRGFASFEDYVDMDIQVLTDVGVLSNKSNSNVLDDDYFSSKELISAWSTYTKLGLNSPVGRGLYAIQLAHWLQAFKATGKDPKVDLLVLQSEHMKNDTRATYKQVVDFLELPPHTLPEFGKIHTTTYRVRTIEEATRFRLEILFRPYNQYLERLLGEDWHKVWGG
jgi:Sulfotransferase domain